MTDRAGISVLISKLHQALVIIFVAGLNDLQEIVLKVLCTKFIGVAAMRNCKLIR